MKKKIAASILALMIGILSCTGCAGSVATTGGDEPTGETRQETTAAAAENDTGDHVIRLGAVLPLSGASADGRRD